MTVGAWNPSSPDKTFTINTQLLSDFIKLSQEEKLDDLNQQVADDTIADQTLLMTQDAEQWYRVASDFDDEQLWHLIRFFTLAEAQLTGWEAGAKSPVIWLNKTLKQRGAALTKDQLRWIRSHSDNRFLPNGAL